MPGTLEIKITQGSVRLYSSLLRLTGTVPFPPPTNFSGQQLTLIVNGLTETFVLNQVGNASNKQGTLRFTKNPKDSSVTNFTIYLHGGNLGNQLAQNVSVDSLGRPKKALIEVMLNGQTGSYITPLNYLNSHSPGLAKFGHITPFNICLT